MRKTWIRQCGQSTTNLSKTDRGRRRAALPEQPNGYMLFFQRYKNVSGYPFCKQSMATLRPPERCPVCIRKSRFIFVWFQRPFRFKGYFLAPVSQLFPKTFQVYRLIPRAKALIYLQVLHRKPKIRNRILVTNPFNHAFQSFFVIGIFPIFHPA